MNDTQSAAAGAVDSSVLLDAIARLAYTVLNQTNFSDMTPEQRALAQALCDYGICQWGKNNGYLCASESERNKTRLVVVCKVVGYTNVHF